MKPVSMARKIEEKPKYPTGERGVTESKKKGAANQLGKKHYQTGWSEKRNHLGGSTLVFQEQGKKPESQRKGGDLKKNVQQESNSGPSVNGN